MRTFWQWLGEQRQRNGPPDISREYDLALQRSLMRLAQEIEDPGARSKFLRLIGSGGSSPGVADYLLGALIRRRIHTWYDLAQT